MIGKTYIIYVIGKSVHKNFTQKIEWISTSIELW